MGSATRVRFIRPSAIRYKGPAKCPTEFQWLVQVRGKASGSFVFPFFCKS